MNKTSKIFAGKNIYYYQTVDSTNLAIRRLADEGAPSCSIVLAEEQQKGRGRLGRSWFSPPGCGLWFSILLRPRMLNPVNAAPITLVTAAIVAENLRNHHNLPVNVKWPNDLLFDAKKLGGILTELKGEPDRVEYIIVGIGLNVNQQPGDFPAELGMQSASLYMAGGRLIDRIDLFLSLRNDLLKAYALFFRNGFTPFRDLWKKNNRTLGQEVTVNWPGGKLEGKALDLTENGSLLIEDKQGQINIVNYGEIN